MRHSHLDVKVSESRHLLARALKDLRAELKLPEDFPAAVLNEAAAAVASVQLPNTDLTELPFVTIDPASSTDLDQALYLRRDGLGYRVWYAIADVPAFVAPGEELDREARRRGQTLYAPDGRIPLHPESISEDAGSLLPDELRSAFVWEFELDNDAAVRTSSVRRAQVRSRAKLSYHQAQQDIDSGGASSSLMLLREVGMKRIALERQRGGASLNLPDQEIAHDGEHYFIASRPPLPVEDWNAQLSLMTGMAAAEVMLAAKVGILRTMPPPDERAVTRFRTQAAALGHPWPPEVPYGEYLRTLDAANPRHLALMHAAGSLFRGAGYTHFDGSLPERIEQAAIAAPYAHATAPLRRLVDRFVLVICESLGAGRDIPGWVREALPLLPELMAASDQLASRLDKNAIGAVEAALLSNRVGQEFTAVVIQGSREPGNGTSNGNGNGGSNSSSSGGSSSSGSSSGSSSNEDKQPYGVIQISEPAVTARCDGILESGTHIRVRLVRADIARRDTRFELVGPSLTGPAGADPGKWPAGG